MYKLDGHRGCVNSLSFNRGGDMLLSASDDRSVVVWDWAADRRILSFETGHTGNVFQVSEQHLINLCRTQSGQQLVILSFD